MQGTPRHWARARLFLEGLQGADAQPGTQVDALDEEQMLNLVPRLVHSKDLLPQRETHVAPLSMDEVEERGVLIRLS